jgi:hypothetical protein
MSTPFANPITGGQGTLLRSQIKSPDFSEAAQTGWAILKNGDAFFFNITASGTITAAEFDGTDFVINKDGLFFYSSAASGNPVFGADNAAFTDIETGLSLAAIPGYRANNTPAQGVPGTWPGPGASPIPSGVTTPAIGIKPGGTGTVTAALTAVVAGTFDTQLAAYFAGIVVPPNGKVFQTAWHEVETSGVAAALLIAFHSHVYPIFQANAPAGAVYGQTFTAFTANPASSHYPVPQWVCCAANGGVDLDYYAVDGYQPSGSTATPAAVFGPWLTQLQTVVPSPVIAVFETNVDVPNTDAATWFAQAWAWAIANQAETFMIFYGAGTFAPDGATVTELQAIAAQSGTGTPQLIASISATAGTDEFGNPYPAGIALFNVSGGDFLRFSTNDSSETAAGVIAGQQFTKSLGASVAPALTLESPGFGHGATILNIIGDSADGSIGGYVTLDSPLVAIQPGFSTTPEAWHAMALGNSWAYSGVGPQAQYRMNAAPGNTIEIIGDLHPGTVTDGTVIATLPAAYFPASTQAFGVVLPAGTPTSNVNMRMALNPAGQLQCEGMAGLTATSRVAFHALISLDA